MWDRSNWEEAALLTFWPIHLLLWTIHLLLKIMTDNFVHARASSSRLNLIGTLTILTQVLGFTFSTQALGIPEDLTWCSFAKSVVVVANPGLAHGRLPRA